jgi:ribosomal protein S18 acetylase RimI-like enzyme
LRPLPMHSDDDHPVTSIRAMAGTDRPKIAELIVSVENFNQAEIDCALELVDIYLNNPNQSDYHVVVAEDAASRVRGYACWGPVPLTRDAYDLYWIAAHPDVRGRGFGRALMAHVEQKVQEKEGRLLVVETSSKSSYIGTVEFYVRLGYETVSRIKDFYDVGDDKLTMVKRFS